MDVLPIEILRLIFRLVSLPPHEEESKSVHNDRPSCHSSLITFEGETSIRRVRQTEAQIKALETKVKQSDLQLVAELGTSTISIEDFLTMNIGDVIQLDQKISDPLILRIGDIPKFTVQPGKLKKKMAVQIIETLKGGEEDE